MKIAIKSFERIRGSTKIPTNGLVIYMMQECQHCHVLARRLNCLGPIKSKMKRKYFVYSEKNKKLPQEVNYFPSYYVDGRKVKTIPRKYIT